MLDLIRKLYQLLTRQERRHVFTLMGIITLMALFETAGIASILPFMAVLAQPEVVQVHPVLSYVYEGIGFVSTDHFLWFLGLGVLAVLVFGNAFLAFGTWQIFRFNWLRVHSIGRRLLMHYLAQPYTFFLGRNSAELTKNILIEVERIVVGIIAPFMRIITKLIVVVFIFGLLLIVDPLLALLVTSVLSTAYAAVYVVSRRKLNQLGAQAVEDGTARQKAITEAFGGIKEAKLGGYETTLLERFRVPSMRYAHSQAVSTAVGYLPKYVIEVLAFGGIMLIVLYLVQDQATTGALPILALYAFAGYRLAPALHQIFEGTTAIRFNKAALDAVIRDLSEFRQDTSVIGSITREEPLHARERIQLKNIDFRYAATNAPVLSSLSLTICANQTIGVVGKSGSGKSTLADVLLGLLPPDAGAFCIDGNQLTQSETGRWQRSIGYVPQNIFLADTSVSENIAFGIPKAEIDKEGIERAARLAQIRDFIIDELPNGYETLVGEGGIRLSGGQRQRIGIARALYHEPSFMVFDEATSALDGATEQAVIEAIRYLKGSRTILIIAHRKSTLKDCDIIVRLDHGHVDECLTWDDLTSDIDRSESDFGTTNC